MPIDFNSSINKVSSFTFGSPLLNNMLNSPFAVSFAIAVMSILLIMFLYPAKSGTPIMTLVRLFVYTLLSTTLFVFLHDGVRASSDKEANMNKKDEALMRGITSKDKELYNLIGQKTIDSPEITAALAPPQQPAFDNAVPRANNVAAPPIATDQINMNGAVLGGSEMKSFGGNANIFRTHMNQFAMT
jgi:hypothetical protein